MTFKYRLQELLHELPITEAGSRVDLQQYSKWKIQVKCFLTHYLGQEHPYTLEFNTMLVQELDPYSLSSYLLVGKGILHGLSEDVCRGLIRIHEE